MWCLTAIIGSIGLLTLIGGAIDPVPAAAQSITPDPNAPGTIVNQNANIYTITGGNQTNANLVHNLQRFGLNPGEIATFVSNPSIQNILAQINGGEPSIVNGLVQVVGGNSNLSLLNAAGVIFGPTASLNVPAAFSTGPLPPLGPPTPTFRLAPPPPLPFGNLLIFNPPQGITAPLRLLPPTAPGLPIAPTPSFPNASTPRPSSGPLSVADPLLRFEMTGPRPNPLSPLSLTPLPQNLTGGTGGNATTAMIQNGIIRLSGSGITDRNSAPIATRSNANNPVPPLNGMSSPPLVASNACLDASILTTEVSLTQTYDQSLGLKLSDRTAANGCSMLDSIQTATGIQNAILYAMFVPTALNAEPDQAQLELVLIASTHAPVRRRVPAATRGTIKQLANQFRNEITDPSKTDTASYRPLAQQLYQVLIAPIEAELKAQGTQHISFILDPALSTLPLAALYDRTSQQFLIQKYSLSLMPSLSLTDTRYRNIRTTQVLAMGRSTFTDAHQSPLPAVPVELALITQTLWSGKAFLNEQFTLENFKRQRQSDFGIVHLATHGEFKLTESVSPNPSSVQILKPEESQPDTPASSYLQLWDTQLRLNQWHDLQLNDPPIELLVLSACRTAIGDRHTTLGFAGLAVQAGVKSVLASLWYVSDLGTLGLITEFYQQLGTASTKAEALRQTQIAMFQGQVKVEAGQLVWTGGQQPLPDDLTRRADLSHPYYWAGFTLIGNPW